MLNYGSIIASTIGGDIKDFESKAHKIEKEGLLTKQHLQCLGEYTNKSREEQEQIREQSRMLSCSPSFFFLVESLT